jgi:predicted GNAT family acetyltransferase
MTLEILDDEAAQRYEARDDGSLAGFLDYVVKHDRLALIHTEVLPSHKGRGVGERIVRFALDDARQRGLRVIVICSYARAYVERHPEVQDIVVGMTPVANADGQARPG